MSPRLNPVLHRGVLSHYVCANCWGDLHQQPTGEHGPTGSHVYTIACITPGCPCEGYVSKHHIEYTEALARMERYQVWQALKSVLPWVSQRGPDKRYEDLWDPNSERAIPTRPARSNDQLLQELGY